MAEQSRVKFKTIEELKQHWDNQTEIYSIVLDKNLTPPLISMTNMLKIHECDTILEVACGTGLLVPYLLTIKKKDSKLYLTDLSKNMLAVTKKRIETYV